MTIPEALENALQVVTHHHSEINSDILGYITSLLAAP